MNDVVVVNCNSEGKKYKTLADAVLNNELNLKALAQKDDNEVLKSLTKLHGIGLWTAKMFLIFALDRQDIHSFEDVAFLQSDCWMYNTNDRT